MRGIVFLPLLFLGCQDDGDPELVFQTTLAVQNASGQDSTTFAVGESVTMILQVTNLTRSPQTLVTPSYQIVFQVFAGAGSEVIWDSRIGVLIPAVVTQLDFQSHETRTFTVVWDQSSNTGASVPAQGIREAQGYAGTTDEQEKTNRRDYSASQIRSARVPFTLQ